FPAMVTSTFEPAEAARVRAACRPPASWLAACPSGPWLAVPVACVGLVELGCPCLGNPRWAGNACAGRSPPGRHCPGRTWPPAAPPLGWLRLADCHCALLATRRWCLHALPAHAGHCHAEELAARLCLHGA
ncbi:hypothetical protein Dimus_003848, partial [Dionaea muscipula]